MRIPLALCAALAGLLGWMTPLTAGAQVPLLTPGIYEHEATVGSIYPGRFTLVSDRNQVITVWTRPDLPLPSQIQVGERVFVEVEAGSGGSLVLRSIRSLSPIPRPPARP